MERRICVHHHSASGLVPQHPARPTCCSFQNCHLNLWLKRPSVGGFTVMASLWELRGTTACNPSCALESPGSFTNTAFGPQPQRLWCNWSEYRSVMSFCDSEWSQGCETLCCVKEYWELGLLRNSHHATSLASDESLLSQEKGTIKASGTRLFKNEKLSSCQVVRQLLGQMSFFRLLIPSSFPPAWSCSGTAEAQVTSILEFLKGHIQGWVRRARACPVWKGCRKGRCVPEGRKLSSFIKSLLGGWPMKTSKQAGGASHLLKTSEVEGKSLRELQTWPQRPPLPSLQGTQGVILPGVRCMTLAILPFPWVWILIDKVSWWA